jgi:hypothetical protein
LRHELVLDFLEHKVAKLWHLRDTIHHITDD